nr:hypothetical protein [uncultured Sphingomonas sp.]
MTSNRWMFDPRGLATTATASVFSEGAKNGEAGSLLYYYRL